MSSSLVGLRAIDLPGDQPRAVHPFGAEAVLVRRVPDDLAASARGYAGTHGVQLLAVWQAAVLTVLHRHTDRTELAIRTGATGVLQDDLSGEPIFADLVARCADGAGQAAAFRIDLDRPGRDGRTGDDGHSSDIVVALQATADGQVELSVRYAPNRFDAGWVERLVDHVGAALAGGLANPGRTLADIDILPPAERELLLHTWNPPRPPSRAVVCPARCARAPRP